MGRSRSALSGLNYQHRRRGYRNRRACLLKSTSQHDQTRLEAFTRWRDSHHHTIMVLEIDWAIRNCTGNGQEDAFDFNSNDADGAWWEGTARMIVAASLARTRARVLC